jgi:hypothetical protein
MAPQKPKSRTTLYIGVVLTAITLAWLVVILHRVSQATGTVPPEENSNKGPILAISKPVANPPPQKRSPVVEPAKVSEEFVVVFSTDCTPYQDWQSLLVFHSAKEVKQPGRVVRIASGCDEAKQRELTDLYAQLHPEYAVHFTPDYKTDPKTKQKYHFYNKPFGLRHWLENSNPPILPGTVIGLIDPDFIFLRPLTAQMAGQNNNLVSGRVKMSEIFEKVERGRPVSQQYGLGAPWVIDDHKKFNRTHICGPKSPCLDVLDVGEGDKYYSVGPPYILEREDFYRLTKSWCDFVPRVYENYPHLLAEMYAYSTAAAHERLPHLRVDHYMVSNVDAGGEGWQWVDELKGDVCSPPVNGIYYPDKPLPTFVHYCQGYRVGDWGYAKRRVDTNIFSCSMPLLADLPVSDLSTMNYFINDKGEVSISDLIIIYFRVLNFWYRKKNWAHDNPNEIYSSCVSVITL